MRSRSYLQRLVVRERVPQAVLTPPRSLFAPRSRLLANNDIAALSETRPLRSEARPPGAEASTPSASSRRGRRGPAETALRDGGVGLDATGQEGELERGPRNASRPRGDRAAQDPIAARARPASRATPSTAPVSGGIFQPSATPEHELPRERGTAQPEPAAGRRSGLQPMSPPATPAGDGAPSASTMRARAPAAPAARPAALDERRSAAAAPKDAAPTPSPAIEPASRVGPPKGRRADARDVLSPPPPPRVAAPTAGDASPSAPASIRIGSLKVRVVAPHPAAPPAGVPPPGRRPGAAKAPPASLARGFRGFGLAQA